MKPHSRPTMIPTNFLSSIRSASSAGNSPVSPPFPPRQRRAFHDAVLDEILQDRLPPRRHRRNKRCVKRKMSNFPLRRRTDKPLPPINNKKAIKILKGTVLSLAFKIGGVSRF